MSDGVAITRLGSGTTFNILLALITQELIDYQCVGIERLERSTTASQMQHSNQLNYIPINFANNPGIEPGPKDLHDPST